jgi:hypothetical protein
MQPQVADCPIAKPDRGGALPVFRTARRRRRNGKTAPILIGSAEFAGVGPAIDVQQTSRSSAILFIL